MCKQTAIAIAEQPLVPDMDCHNHLFQEVDSSSQAQSQD
jgi:hypothetical protein